MKVLGILGSWGPGNCEPTHSCEVLGWEAQCRKHFGFVIKRTERTSCYMSTLQRLCRNCGCFLPGIECTGQSPRCPRQVAGVTRILRRWCPGKDIQTSTPRKNGSADLIEDVGTAAATGAPGKVLDHTEASSRRALNLANRTASVNLPESSNCVKRNTSFDPERVPTKQPRVIEPPP